MATKQEECKHEGQAGMIYCGLCGKQLTDPEAQEERNTLKSLISEVLAEHGLTKKTPAEPPKKTRKSLAERIGGINKK